MKEILYTLIFTAILMGSVYAYAVYATRTGLEEDENKNFIPDSWEKKFKWAFTGKAIIMFALGFGIGFLTNELFF
tara:strand:- start:297 stop:521 length:225 start_codon:yes stop_codon:yes gene_type:complete